MKILALPRLSISLSQPITIATTTWPYIAVFVAHFLWGINFLVAKLTLQEIPLMSLAFLRFTLAVIFILPFLLTDKSSLKVDKEDIPRLIIIGALMVSLNIGLFFAGLERTTITSAAVLTMTTPIFSILLAWWFLKEKVYLKNLGGIALGLIGALLVIDLPSFFSGNTLSSQNMIGNILIALASMCWVVGAILSKKMLKKYSTLTITFVMFLVGSATFLIPAVNEYLQNPGWVYQITPVGISGILFMTLCSSISAFFLFEWGMSRIGVTRANFFQYFEPFVAGSLGILVLGEKAGIMFLVGGILIAIGAYFSTHRQEAHKHSPAHRH